MDSHTLRRGSNQRCGDMREWKIILVKTNLGEGVYTSEEEGSSASEGVASHKSNNEVNSLMNFSILLLIYLIL